MFGCIFGREISCLACSSASHEIFEAVEYLMGDANGKKKVKSPSVNEGPTSDLCGIRVGVHDSCSH